MNFPELASPLERILPEVLQERLETLPALIKADHADAGAAAEAYESLNPNEPHAQGGDSFTYSRNRPIAKPQAVQGKPSHYPTGAERPTKAETQIKPLSVDEMFARFSRQLKPKMPKFSLSPDKIRINPMQLEQEALGNLVFSLPWDDHNMINPFHTGPCNRT